MAGEGFWNDQEKAQHRVAALKEAKSRIAELDAITTGLDDCEVLLELAVEQGGDAALAEVEASCRELEQRHDALELKTLLSGPWDHCGAVLTFQAGAGGTDASDWAQMLMRMYTRWAEVRGYKVEVLDVVDAEEAGIKHASMRVSGPYAFGYLTAEMGVHRLVRMSPFDAMGRRQTSFAAVDVTPELEEDPDIEVLEKDLRIDTYRAGGAGGQHVNKTESAVRLTHIPTGVVVQCQSERSQHKNKGAAMKMLKAKLLQRREVERDSAIKSMYDNKGEIAWGNKIRSYVLAPYTMVKDLRVEDKEAGETGNVQAVLDGAVQPFIEAYLKQRAKQK